jgi:hypothetical protein
MLRSGLRLCSRHLRQWRASSQHAVRGNGGSTPRPQGCPRAFRRPGGAILRPQEFHGRL